MKLELIRFGSTVPALAGLVFCNLALAQEPPVAAREQLNAVLWQQQAVEYRALAQQAYRTAAARLPGLRANGLSASVEQVRAGGFKSKKPAVVLDIDETVLDNTRFNARLVLDIDETVLDNTRFNARLVLDGRGFDPAAWEAWVLAARAPAVPGAREFISRARALKMRVVYITNRECRKAAGFDASGQARECPQKPATLANLEQALGYRPAESDLLMRFEREGRDDSDKQARRLEVARTHRIAMLVGDDLNDFIRRGDYLAETHGVHWAADAAAPWFALPNAIYGSWEKGFANLAARYAALDAWALPAPGPGPQPGPSPPPGPLSLKLVAWNLEWLADPAVLAASRFWERCAAQGFPNAKLADELPFCDVYKRDGINSAAELEQKKLVPMRQRLAEFAAQGVDVIAVQEVGGPSALAAVLPPGYEVACFTTRVDAQNLGYAVRTAAGLQVACREVASLSLEGVAGVPRPVRRGLELSVAPGGDAARAVTLLNVHLKSSCPKGRMDGSNTACRTLQRQAAPLEAWIEEQSAAGRAFAILGDWNRDLEAEAAGNFTARSDASDPSGPLDPAVLRNLWPEINDAKPATSAMELAKVDRSAARGAGACHDILDQFALSVLLRTRLDPASLDGGRLPAAFLARPVGASDHCPLFSELKWR